MNVKIPKQQDFVEFQNSISQQISKVIDEVPVIFRQSRKTNTTASGTSESKRNVLMFLDCNDLMFCYLFCKL